MGITLILFEVNDPKMMLQQPHSGVPYSTLEAFRWLHGWLILKIHPPNLLWGASSWAWGRIETYPNWGLGMPEVFSLDGQNPGLKVPQSVPHTPFPFSNSPSIIVQSKLANPGGIHFVWIPQGGPCSLFPLPKIYLDEHQQNCEQAGQMLS